MPLRMKLFQIDYKRLVLLLLPTFLRRPRIFAFLTAFVFGISEIHARFLKSREAALCRIRRNGQVCHLGGMLNDEFDPALRRITITDGDAEGDWLMAMHADQPYQLFVGNGDEFVYAESLIIANTAIFYVCVPWPQSDVNQTNRMRNLLNEYKLLSKKYTIRHE